MVSAAEIDARLGSLGSRPDVTAGVATTPAAPAPHGPPASVTSFRSAPAPPRFAVGAAVVTRTMHPAGHTRLPRYARGKRGVVAAHRGCHVFPDTNAHGLGEQPQHVYSVRLDAGELWGEAAEPNQRVHLDLCERYLLPG